MPKSRARWSDAAVNARISLARWSNWTRIKKMAIDNFLNYQRPYIFHFKINRLKRAPHSHSIVNELAKRLIFQCFPNHSGTDTLKNTLTCKIRYCLFVATEMKDTSPLAHTCHPILLGENAFISAQLQSKRSDKLKDTPILSATLSPCH
ncbi:hypothetical protein GCN78_18310 [Janthinobacterium rivuli]|uniref:hypothetical protein n=1 Tax=Janthinobacterium sp. FT68W TaxID=2654255 RepID=UPI0012644BDF|nr:hypothetical protein [Janthinobacterium sp. FT68W]KAB8048695.1 hypothetical protein GCN78_18310 [Janthinobacterium sp. FT68W]